MTSTRIRAAAIVAVVTSSTAALAGPFEIGAGVGLTQTSSDAGNGASSQQVDSIFARLGLLGPLAAQLEVGRVDLTDASVRTATADAVLQVAFGRFVPFVLAGFGVDDESRTGMSSPTFTHTEVGAGLEIRITGGFTIGLDLREGSRSSTSGDPPGGVVDPIANTGARGAGVVHLTPEFTPTSLASGDYRVARLTLGIAF